VKPERTIVSGHAARRYLERVAAEPADIPAVQRLIHHDVVCALREGRRSVAQPRWTVEHQESRRRKASLGCRFRWPADMRCAYLVKETVGAVRVITVYQARVAPVPAAALGGVPA
jgi:hypothetical protein